jgi:DNA-binding CsgD family transcriptional regulator/predicted nucleic acid-binding protein
VANTYRTEMLIIVFREGRTDACLEASANGLAYAEQHCGPRWRAEFRLDLCLGYVEAGCFTDAEPLFEPLLTTVLDDLRRLTVLQTAGLHALGTGSLDVAGVFLADASEIADRYASAQETGFQARLLAELARREGRLDDAVESIDRALELQLAGDNLTYTRESIVEKIRIVRACAEAGRGDADDLLAAVAVLVHDFDGAGSANVAIRSLMELELASIDGTFDPGVVDETVRSLESSGFRYEAAQARLLAIEQLDGSSGDRGRLESEVTELLATANDHGMVWIAERVTSLARARRITVDPAMARGPSAPIASPRSLPYDLTPREVEVMSLLAEGFTNKAIGEELYVSPRTVGTHVSNLLAKLGLSNRGEAAAAYRRLGLEEVIDLRDPLETGAERP